MRRLLLLLLGLLLIFLLSYLCFTEKSESIREDLLSNAKRAYATKSMEWVSTSVEGEGLKATRILTLTGTAKSTLEKDEAERVANRIEGITFVQNHIHVDDLGKNNKNGSLLASNEENSSFLMSNEENDSLLVSDKEKSIILSTPSFPIDSSKRVIEGDSKITFEENNSKDITPMPSNYSLSVLKSKENHVVLEGDVPNVKAHQLLAEEAKRVYGETNIIDELKESLGTPKEWTNTALFALHKLVDVDYGKFEMKNETFKFQAHVETAEKKRILLKDLKDKIAQNYTTEYAIESPIEKTVIVSESNVTLEEEPVEKEFVEVASPAEVCQDSFRNYLSKERVNFATNKAVLKKSSYALLNHLQEIASSCPLTTIIIEGHTDSDGSKKYNENLSKKRANAVKNYLIKHGVKKERLIAIGYGELQPIASNTTQEGKRKNRRIELNVKGVE